MEDIGLYEEYLKNLAKEHKIYRQKKREAGRGRRTRKILAEGVPAYIDFMLDRLKGRAKKKGLDFDLAREDVIIPEVCPVLGLKLEAQIGKGRPSHCSPSLDRMDNSRGYTKDNIKVISYRANWLKNNASIEELEKILGYMRNP